jgi:hypothetical protein
MRRLIIFVLILLALDVTMTSCVSSRKNNKGLGGLMIQDNTRIGRNKAFYSRHNVKTKKIAHRKYRRNNR